MEIRRKTIGFESQWAWGHCNASENELRVGLSMESNLYENPNPEPVGLRDSVLQQNMSLE